MRIAIVGSREFQDYSYMQKVLKPYLQSRQIEQIVSGGARGADSLGRKFALDNNIPYIEFPPEWNKYGKSAGYRRNVQIVDASDLIIAFRVLGLENKGTNHTIKTAKEKGKEVIVCDYSKGNIEEIG